MFIAAAFVSPSLAQINVLMSGGFAGAYDDLRPSFEKTTGIAVTTTRGPSQGNTPNSIPAQLRKGFPADVVIISSEGLSEIEAEGRIMPGTVVSLAQARLGVAVRAGAARPDISSLAAFKQMVFKAKSINLVSSPALYLTEKVFPKLGIPSEVAGKIKGSTLAEVASGQVELAIRPVSEIVNVPGVDFVGILPDEIDFVSVFKAAIVAGSKNVDAAKQLIAFLASENAGPAIRRSGMEPVRSK
jgi:molybdate transport system substrate-binding protein